MSLVVNSSIIVAWLMPDEDDAVAVHAIQEIIRSGADVPSLFLSEVANVLTVNSRRGRIGSPMTFLTDLLGLEFREDSGASFEAVSRAVVLAERHGLTVYDATYLELALRLGRPLATLDKPLARAATDAGVPLFVP